MESKHKNALIGALLAVVFVMAVGYAAFAQQLTINGSAEINSSWDISFDQSKTTGPGVVDAVAGLSGATAPTGKITYSDGHNANVSATLNQPGDTVTFTLTIQNNGTISADLQEPVVTMDADEESAALVARKGNIQFTVTPASPTTIGSSETATMTVKAEFIASAESVGTTTSASVTITVDAVQSQA